MRAIILVVAAMVAPALHAWQSAPGGSSACGLGVKWVTSENGWAGTWVRRGNTDNFDATWQKDGVSGNSTITISLTGSRVHVERRDAAAFGGASVVYEGTIASDGTVSGTGRVGTSSAPYPFRATVYCGDAGVTSACGLGARWVTEENGWTGTWVRRGNTSTFDATWQKEGASGSSTITISLTGNRVHVERRDAAAFGGASVDYQGTMASDGTVSGTGRTGPSGAPYPFRATVACR